LLQLALWVVGRFGGASNSNTRPAAIVDLVMKAVNSVPMGDSMQTTAMLAIAHLVVAARLTSAQFTPALNSYLQQRLYSKNMSHQRVAHWIYSLAEYVLCPLLQRHLGNTCRPLTPQSCASSPRQCLGTFGG
jgi:hypothetical protein